MDAKVGEGHRQNGKLSVVSLRQTVPHRLKATLIDGSLTLEGDMESLLAAVIPNTRTIRLSNETESDSLRIDLPPLKLEGAGSKKHVESGGPIVVMRATNLLPGFKLCASFQRLPRVVSATGRGFEAGSQIPDLQMPQVVEVRSGQHGDEITVKFAGKAESDEPSTYYLSLENLDGSRSACICLTQAANSISGKATLAAGGLSVPVDSDVIVPSVEVFTAAEAIKTALDAGLQPIVFDIDSLQELLPGAHENLLVLRQGIEGGSKALRGTPLLLGVRADGGFLANLASSRSHSSSRSGSTQGVIDIGDTLGFVSVHPPSRQQFDPLINETAVAGAQSQQSSSTATQPDNTAPKSGAPNQDIVVVPVDPDPGVDINPTHTVAQTRQLGLLKVQFEALRNSTVLEGLGPIGKTIGATQADERAIGQAIASGKLRNQLPIDPLLDRLLKALEINLSAPKRAAVLNAYRNKSTESQQSDLDVNGNGRVSDDIMFCLARLLVENGDYNPATHMQLAKDGLGRPVAILTTSVASTALSTRSALGSSKIAPIVPRPVLAIPQASATVTMTGNPNSVRVPSDLVGGTVREAIDKLKIHGLQPADPEKLFKSDKVTLTMPAAGTWVARSSAVNFVIAREVPALVTKTVADSQAALSAKGMVAKLVSTFRARPDDIVVRQKPAAGAIVAAATTVELTVKRRIPDLTSFTINDSLARAREAEFRLEIPQDFISSDVVEQQSPASSTLDDAGLADPNSVIKVVKVKTLMPDLKGTSLGNAKTLIEAKQVFANLKLQMQVTGVPTTYPQARVVSQSPIAGSAVDRRKDVVKVSLAVRLPQLGRTDTAVTAIQQLRKVDLIAEMATKQYLETDQVLGVAVIGDRYLDGGNVYANPGAKVRIDLGRAVPRLAGLPWQTAREKVESTGLTVAPPFGRATDVVSDTIPKEGAMIHVNSKIVLVPGIKVPNVERSSLSDARTLLSKDGFTVVLRGRDYQDSDNPQLVGTTVVVAQVPKAGMIVALSEHRQITIDAVHYRKQAVVVPLLTGLNIHQSRAKAADAGINLRYDANAISQVPTADNTLLNQTLVDDQDLPEGKQVPAGTAVTVHFVQYVPEEVESAEIPELRGHEVREAAGIAVHAGMRIHPNAVHDSPVDDSTTAGTIVVGTQQPDAGVQLPKGSTIEVQLIRYVWKGPEFSQVPELRGHDFSEAEAIANNAGLGIQPMDNQIQQPTLDQNLIGRTVVTAQGTSAGTQVQRGSMIVVGVTVYVAGQVPVVPNIPMTRVPDFRNCEIAVAQQMAAQSQLQIGGSAIDLPTNQRNLLGRTLVHDQAIPAGAEIPVGSVIGVNATHFVPMVQGGTQPHNVRGSGFY